jgi:hypothetical protein
MGESVQTSMVRQHNGTQGSYSIEASVPGLKGIVQRDGSGQN